MRPEMLVRELRAHEVVLVLHVFDPRLALRLRVDHERRTQRTRRQNSVLNGQLVVGQTLEGGKCHSSTAESCDSASQD